MRAAISAVAEATAVSRTMARRYQSVFAMPAIAVSTAARSYSPIARSIPARTSSLVAISSPRFSHGAPDVIANELNQVCVARCGLSGALEFLIPYLKAALAHCFAK